MKHVVIAFDDSGGIEALCQWDGTPIPGDHPITALTGFFVDRTVQAEFGDIQRWVSQYGAVVDEFVKHRLAGWFFHTLHRRVASEAQRRYLQHPDFRREMQYIRAHSQRLYRGYHRLSTSPLLMLYTRSLLYAAEITRATGAESIMDVLVDSFGDSHGIDTAETVATMKWIASLDHIGTVERVDDGDASAPVQAADLIGFARFRLEMAAGGHIHVPMGPWHR